jgi:hypothetical protein
MKKGMRGKKAGQKKHLHSVAATGVMKKGMKVQGKQMQDLLGGASTEQSKMQKSRKSSEIAAQSSGLGVNLNIKG